MNAGSVGAALTDARLLGLARLDAHALLAHALGRPRVWLIAHEEALLDAAQAARFASLAARRAAGEPLAYLIGTKEFHGLALAVSPATLVPRPETELLVDWAIELLASRPGAKPPRVVDLGTGSGAIALAVKHARPDAVLTAVDASEAALEVARGNGRRLGLEVEWLRSDWWSALTGRRFDMTLANPPYVAEGDDHLVGLAYEPASALVSGAQGLDALQHLVATAPTHLHPGGWLLLEHGYEQGQVVRECLSRSGFTRVATRLDLSGLPRCSAATLAA
ncbi:MAG TPA: peptide chain release factor N(5)-glutamine methyltransferase [Ideonella sp.]|nr:peptide chain release factor N(5)-glutamine methyltransferase [Ideonella sp.]